MTRRHLSTVGHAASAVFITISAVLVLPGTMYVVVRNVGFYTNAHQVGTINVDVNIIFTYMTFLGGRVSCCLWEFR